MMKSNLINCIFALSIIGLVSIHGCVQQVREPTPTPKEKLSAPAAATGGLKTLAEQRGILFGSLYQYDIRSEIYDQLFETEMNAMTVGTFWTNGSRPNRIEFNFSEMDNTVNWGRARGMQLYGQTLVWFEDIPDWLKAAPTADVEQIMNQHIDTVVGRYAGQIKFWNVVNEAISPDGTLRQNNTWTDAMGTSYISKAFIRAHAADPIAVLYYNDFEIESNQAKFEGVKALLISLKNQGVPVAALGWQLHVRPGSFDAATLLERMNEIADLGFDNYITELDVELPVNASVTDYEQQKQTYKTVVETFLAANNHKSIVVWGLRDGDPYWLTNSHPLLFDENFNKKPAYFGVQEALNSTLTTTTSTTTSSTTGTSTTTSTSPTTSTTSTTTTSSTSTTSTTSSSTTSTSTSQMSTKTSSSKNTTTVIPTSATSTTSLSSSSSTTSSQTTTSSSTQGGGGGIPEFPYQILAVILFTFILVASYLLARQRGIPGGKVARL